MVELLDPGKSVEIWPEEALPVIRWYKNSAILQSYQSGDVVAIHGTLLHHVADVLETAYKGSFILVLDEAKRTIRGEFCVP